MGIKIQQNAQEFLSTPSARRATYQLKAAGGYKIFLSTPSARRATTGVLYLVAHDLISIHALREEGDPFRFAFDERTLRFLSTPSARRATNGHQNSAECTRISIHALREEGDGAGTR